MNKTSDKGSSSRFKGVSWGKSDNKWISAICVNQQRFRIGAFANELDAARAYDAKAREMFGEFARLNFQD